MMLALRSWTLRNAICRTWRWASMYFASCALISSSRVICRVLSVAARASPSLRFLSWSRRIKENVSRLAESVFANNVRACRSSWMPSIRQVSSAGTDTASASSTISRARNELNRGSQRTLRRLSSDTDVLADCSIMMRFRTISPGDRTATAAPATAPGCPCKWRSRPPAHAERYRCPGRWRALG